MRFCRLDASKGKQKGKQQKGGALELYSSTNKKRVEMLSFLLSKRCNKFVLNIFLFALILFKTNNGKKKEVGVFSSYFLFGFRSLDQWN